MVRENRRSYRLAGLSVGELNFILEQVADRLDQLEGYRGTPSFLSAPDMGGNRVMNVGTPILASDAATNGDLNAVSSSLDVAVAAQSGYLNKAGQAGGQVAYGGTGSGQSLILYSTTNATKGWVGYADSTGTILHGWRG